MEEIKTDLQTFYNLGATAGKLKTLAKLVGRIEGVRIQRRNEMSKGESDTLEMVLEWIVEIEKANYEHK